MQHADPHVRVGIVGCGSFGKGAYARNVVSYPDAEVAAICDLDPDRTKDLIREYCADQPPAVYTAYKEMIATESLDVVMAGTMADIRPQVVLAALDKGAHVLAAKPMAPSLQEAEQMMEAAKKADRLLMVGYNFRFRTDAQILHQFIQDSGLGTPLFARVFSHQARVPVWGPHYIKARSAGGSVASTAVHVIDLAVWFLQNPALLSVDGHTTSRFANLPDLPPDLEAVRNTYDTEDLASGFARFADGITMTVEGMWLTPPDIDRMGVDIWGTHGYASLVPFRLFTWQNGDYADRTEALAPNLAETFTDDSRVRTTREVHHFLDCVLGKAEPLITPQEMWTDQAIVDGIYAGHLTFNP